MTTISGALRQEGTLLLGAPPVRIVDSRPDGGYTGVFEIK